METERVVRVIAYAFTFGVIFWLNPFTLAMVFVYSLSHLLSLPVNDRGMGGNDDPGVVIQ